MACRGVCSRHAASIYPFLDTGGLCDLRAASIQEMMHSVPVTSAAAPEVTKLRRDTKSCFEQNPCATACGDVPLVTVPLLGRSVRIYGDWHSLCAYCGALFKMTPLTRFRGDPCCTRCDFAMLHGTEKEAEMLSKRPKAPAPNCRYCGRPEPASAANKKTQASNLASLVPGSTLISTVSSVQDFISPSPPPPTPPPPPLPPPISPPSPPFANETCAVQCFREATPDDYI